jgi:hypothetical protein
MRSLHRRVAASVIVLCVAVLATDPADLKAQGKKDSAPAKKDENAVEIATSDGLRLNALWYPGSGADKNPPDAVLMFPAPGNKVTDSWIALAKALSEKSFSVLLMDWRGCGMNAADTAGARIINDKDVFWKEQYNQKLLKSSQKSIETKGLDYKVLKGKAEGAWHYTDFMMNDLLAARFYLDKQNDDGKCNSGRIWLVTEKDGGQIALGFIAAELMRESIYTKNPNQFVPGRQFRSAGLDFVGVTCLSWGGKNPTGEAFYTNGLSRLARPAQREATDYFQHRLAMILMYGWKEGPNPSRGALAALGADASDPDALKKDNKLVIEINNSKAPGAAAGIGLIDSTDSFGAKTEVRKAMVEIGKAISTKRQPVDRDANKVQVIPRIAAETLGRR